MDGWSYFTLTLKNPDIAKLDGRINALGAEGWELVTALSTIKTWLNVTGNDLVLLFKKAGVEQRPTPAAITAAAGLEGLPDW